MGENKDRRVLVGFARVQWLTYPPMLQFPTSFPLTSSCFKALPVPRLASTSALQVSLGALPNPVGLGSTLCHNQ